MSAAATSDAAGDLSPPPATSDSETTSSEESSSTLNPKSAIENSIFAAYLQINGGDSLPRDLIKIRSFLSSSRHALSCLICLDPIRPSDPTWSCSSSCHVTLHLPCIQNWAHQSSHNPNSSWHCPKCRAPSQTLPKSYLCFCGTQKDPPFDPWLLPHSCGDTCARPLPGNCGHHCLLLCHPGPCPPCPKQVVAFCFCGSRNEPRRCSRKNFSCNEKCEKFLPCKIHRCVERCHEGDCPPCGVEGLRKCACGKVEEKRVCARSEFRCDGVCGGILLCGRHGCERGCHAGPCGDCGLKGRRSCPCGKKEYKGVSCDEEVGTCGLTCEKVLGCGLHRCPERCHRGVCVETCRIVVFKACRCGSLKKEVWLQFGMI